MLRRLRTGRKKTPGMGPVLRKSPASEYSCHSKAIGNGESNTAWRRKVLDIAVFGIGIGGRPKEVVDEERCLMVEHVEHRDIEVEPVVSPLERRFVIQIEVQAGG